MKYIYKISNSINDKIYIGQTVNIEERWRTHLRLKGNCTILKAAMLKHGKENFKLDVLAIVEDYMADETEVGLISLYNTVSPNGYNISVGGCGVSHFIWKDEYNKLLGTASDNEIGKLIGCSSWVVRSYRVALNIPHYNPLESLDISLLGTMKDTELSALSGVHKTTIQKLRDKYGIRRFSVATIVSEEDLLTKTPTCISESTGIPISTINSYKRRVKDRVRGVPIE